MNCEELEARLKSQKVALKRLQIEEELFFCTGGVEAGRTFAACDEYREAKEEYARVSKQYRFILGK